MGIYVSTSTTILPLFPDLPQTTTTAGYTETTAIISAHIDYTDAYINGKIAKRYSLPFAVVPANLRPIAADITAFRSYRSFYAQDNQNTAARINEYANIPDSNSAFDLLEQIRAGDFDLVYTTGALVPEATGNADARIEDANEDYSAIFNVDGILDQSVDCDRLDAVRSERE